MKLYNVITIIFLASLILFMPLARPGDEYELSTFEEKSIILNVQNSKISITANLPDDIFITVFYLDPAKNNLTEVLPTQTFKSNIEITVNKKGFYRLDFLSENIITITISTNTLPKTSLIIVSITLTLMIIFQIRKQFSRSFAY